MNCQTCGRKAPDLINKILEEDNYSGDYFCDEECRAKSRARDEDFGQT